MSNKPEPVVKEVKVKEISPPPIPTALTDKPAENTSPKKAPTEKKDPPAQKASSEKEKKQPEVNPESKSEAPKPPPPQQQQQQPVNALKPQEPDPKKTPKSPPYVPSMPSPAPPSQSGATSEAKRLPVVGGNEFVVKGYNYLVPVPSPSLNEELDVLVRILNQNRETLKKMLERLLTLYGEKENPSSNQVHASIRSALISFKIIEQLIPLINLKGGSAVFSDEEGDICACIESTISKGTGIFLEKELQKAKEKEKMSKQFKCYVATLCYGENASIYLPVFQNFRDDFLQKRLWGRFSINLYYLISPFLIAILSPFPKAQRIIRREALDPIRHMLLKKGFSPIRSKSP